MAIAMGPLPELMTKTIKDDNPHFKATSFGYIIEPTTYYDYTKFGYHWTCIVIDGATGYKAVYNWHPIRKQWEHRWDIRSR